MKKRRRKFKVLAVVLVFFAAWFFIAPFLAKNLIVERPLEKADAILVLAGSHTYLERTRKASELYNKGVASFIYLTDDGEQAGWNQTEQRNPSFVELARKNLIARGVAAENIEILPSVVDGTIDEARLMSEKSKSAQFKTLLIVTSAYHTRRALATFQKIFSENNQNTTLGIVSPPAGEQTPTPAVWWLSPFGWRMVAGEYVKILYYWVYY